MNAKRARADIVRRRVLVSGRVQGVWFRETCRERAGAAGVGGLVRNLPDGRVEAVFEGTLAAVDQLVEWCRHGPPRATVTAIDVRDEAPVGDQAFRVG